jgi:hypothetical protein
VAVGEAIGLGLIATGFAVAGATILWFMCEAQDDARAEGIWGDFPEVPSDFRDGFRAPHDAVDNSK